MAHHYANPAYPNPAAAGMSNVSPAMSNVSPAMSNVAPVATKGAHAPMTKGYGVAPAAYGAVTTTGTILVLYILLVIISRVLAV